ncbi:MAG: PAS domain S-box protein [Deltaproteobacteria bacterium]|nr:PAS domain S-box protein [Deltaproteobacteria bacterium]
MNNGTLIRERPVVEKRIEGLKRRLDKLRVEKRTLREKITDLRKQHQQTVKSLKEGWRLLEALPGGVVLIQDGKIGFINEAARQALGCDEDDIKGRDFVEFIHPEFRTKLRERHKKRVSGKPVPDRYETCLTSRNGDLLWCEVRVKKILVGGRRAFLLNLIGLNEKREAEKRHVDAEKQEVIARISRGLHHALKEWPGSLEHSPPLFRELEWLGESSREQEGTIAFDLRKVAQDVISIARNQWCKTLPGKEGGIRLKSYLRALPTLVGRPEEIRYALGALVKNAVEALDGEGNIYLTTEESEGFAYLYIQDSGSGIPAEIQDKIYDPFFTTKGKERRGLGLSLARAIIRRNGGEMELRSSNGGGTICTVRMPIPSEPSARKRTARRIRLKDTFVLVVSGQDILRDLLCRWFSSRGCRVDATVTCGEAFQLVARKAYGLLVIDAEEMEADNLAAFLTKAHRTRPKTPIVLMGNPANLRSAKFAKQHDDYFLLEKPLNMDRVYSVFMEALHTRGPAS